MKEFGEALVTDHILTAARSYMANGLCPIPIPYANKAPRLHGWQSLRLRENDLPRYFGSGAVNIGIVLGEASDGLVDIDIDHELAVRLARHFLPSRAWVFGRASRPATHFIYRVNPIPPTMRFEDTDGTVLVELRATGCQTIFPPSIHPSGEAIEFDEQTELTLTNGGVLHERVAALAACALIARHWPKTGSRQHAALALAGGLIRAGWDEARTTEFVSLVAEVVGDEETGKRVEAGAYTADRLVRQRTATGWPRLGRLVGQDTVSRVREWLGLTQDHDDEDQRGKQGEITSAVLSYDEFIHLDIPDRVYHLPWLPQGGLAMVYGPRGAGKTNFGLGLALALVSGTPFMGWQIAAPTGVLYVDGEMALAELQDRCKRLLRAPQRAPLELLCSEFVYQRLGRDLILTAEQARSEITRYLDSHPEVTVVILDNISCLFSGIEEDSKRDWEPINAWLVRLRHRGRSVVLIHHGGKSGEQRGTSGREDSLDTVIQLRVPTDHDPAEGCRFDLRFTKSRSVKGAAVTAVEARLIETNGQLEWQVKPLDEPKLDQLVRLWQTGITRVTDLAEAMGIHKSYASKLLERAKREGRLCTATRS